MLYDLPLGVKAVEGVGVNLRAEFTKGGTWIDLHMSVGTDQEHAAGQRQRLISLIEEIKTTVADTATVSHEQIESALADLTERIEAVDDTGYQKAIGILTTYLESQPLEKYRFTPEAIPWSTEKGLPETEAYMLNTAFLASQLQDELRASNDDRLYHAWLTVIKYYQHYTDPAQTAGKPWPTSAAIEGLIAKEKAGTLQQFASTVTILRK